MEYYTNKFDRFCKFRAFILSEYILAENFIKKKHYITLYFNSNTLSGVFYLLTMNWGLGTLQLLI